MRVMLAESAPYMHDGSLATLEDVVRHYERGGVDRPTRSPDMSRRLVLSDRERQDLVAFLRTLSSSICSSCTPERAPWLTFSTVRMLTTDGPT